jgi:hypothetical protein
MSEEGYISPLQVLLLPHVTASKAYLPLQFEGCASARMITRDRDVKLSTHLLGQLVVRGQLE